MDFENLTVADAARLIEQVSSDNDYLAMDHGGVTVLVAKGRARNVALHALRRRDSHPPKRPRKST